ncbi:MAG: DUF4340 domain-containing protein [Deltaproteobacteria bacterium]|nr:MAG: DUF4340 domain-containing protein [Deltaproteobacteria bacterium]
MDRQTRLLLVLVAVLIGLVALDRFWTPEDPLGNPDATRQVWQLEEPTITRIEAVHSDGRALVLERRDEGWWVLAPFQGKANQRVASRIARVLAEIDKGEPLEVDDPESFGLGAVPQFSVHVLRDGAGELSLDVGRAAPSGWRTYVRSDAGMAIIDGELESSVWLDPDDLRDRHLLDYDPATVRAVRITSEPGTLALHGEGREWWVDGYARADLDAIEQLVAGLLDLQVETFLDDALPDGVPEPLFFVTIERTELPPIELRVGDVTPLGQIVQVVGGTTGAVPADTLRVLGQPPSSVADPHAVPIRQTKPTRIAVDLGDTTWAIDFGEHGWTRTGEEDRDAFAAAELVRNVQTAPQLEPVPAPTESYGTITLTPETGGERVIAFGQLVGDKRVAVDQAGGEPYFVLDAGVQAVIGAFATE